MDKFENIKEYFINLDFEFVNDHEILDNVYKEIEGYEEKLILNLESVTNFEILINKSNLQQIINLCKNINLHFLSLKKTGSKFCEVILDSIFDILIKNNKEEFDMILLEKYVLNIFDDNFKELCVDKNGTHVIRKYIRLIYGKEFKLVKESKIFKESKLVKESKIDKESQLDEESVDIKESKTNKKSKSNIISILDKESKSDIKESQLDVKEYKSDIISILDKEISTDTLITIIMYLKLNYSKQISRILVKKYVLEDNLKNKMYSYIFEDLINISDTKTLSIIFNKIKDKFNEYINDKYAVFFILSLIKKYPIENDFYLSYCEKEMKNNNVLLKVLENYCLLKDVKKIKKVFKKYYGIENEIFKNILLSHTDSPDTKYINLICLLMDLDILRVNKDFIKYFNNEWVHRKYGIKLLKGFFEGGFDNKLKSEFARKINVGGSLNKKKEGKKILSLIKTYKKLKI